MITTMTTRSDDPISRVEVITSVQRRRRWSAAEKVRLVEEAMQPGMSVSFVARRAGIAPSQLFAWKRRMIEGGHAAAGRLIARDVTGIICASDPLALGAIRAARRAGLSVPAPDVGSAESGVSASSTFLPRPVGATVQSAS